tara:strand:- start:7301 stop:7684 length:384 start_codon:yes stop_codon:yes gene_type:complete
MKVDEAIQYLQKLNEDDHILIAWWENDQFPEYSKDDWNGAVETLDATIDWSDTHNLLQQHLKSLQSDQPGIYFYNEIRIDTNTCEECLNWFNGESYGCSNHAPLCKQCEEITVGIYCSCDQSEVNNA